MATIRLVPSNYGRSNTNNVTVTNPSNMYNNTDHTSNYATLRGRAGRSSNSTYYAFINGFNFDDVPSNAIVTNFKVKIKAYRGDYQATGSTSYRISLASQASNSYKIGNTTLSSDITTTSGGTVYEIPKGNLTWDQLVDYGSNFSIEIPLRNSSTSSSNYPYVYVYGAEIEVEYTLPNPVTVTSVLVQGDGTLNPLGTTNTYEDTEYTLTITPSDTSEEVTATKNGVDITGDLVAHYPGTSGTESTNLGTYTLVSGSFNGSGASYFSGIVGNAYNATTTTSNYYSGGSSTIAVFTYNMGITLPSNAIISRVYARVNGHAESTSNSSEYMCARLISGSTNLSDELNFKDVGTSNSTQTLECETLPTVAQLAAMKLQCRLGYYGGAINGATVYVEYTIPSASSNPEYYTYTYIVDGNATIEVTIGSSAPYIPPEEDPEETYYSLTISSINAITTPSSGTTRVIEGTNQTITISSTEPKLTLALDNGNDITSLLSGGPGANYTVTEKVSGATYGFELNSSTGYYVSTNAGVNKSASVARLNLDVTASCILTIEYINYAEANYDYGMFGKLDTTVATDGLTAGSGSSSPSDSTSNYQLAMASNSASTQTISYNLTAGSHFIDIKYGKDDGSDSGNDSLQWKVRSIEPISGSGDYTYTLSNIAQKHSLIFVFGNVNFYYITSSVSSGGRIFPDGQSVVLEGDNYKITIIPDNINAAVSATDNGVNITSNLNQITGVDKNNNSVVNYTYSLSNISAAHNIIISINGATVQIYLKENGVWTPYSKVYKKINGSWVEQNDLSSVFSTTANYVHNN